MEAEKSFKTEMTRVKLKRKRYYKLKLNHTA